jgi:transcriptional regulator with XRE-family HTH domain
MRGKCQVSLLGAKLRELRGSHSLHEVAAELGVDTSVISRYENGKRAPVPEMLEKLAEYYEVDYESLRELYYDEAIPDTREQAILLKWAAKKLGYPPEFIQLVEQLPTLEPDQQRRVLSELMEKITKSS